MKLINLKNRRYDIVYENTVNIEYENYPRRRYISSSVVNKLWIPLTDKNQPAVTIQLGMIYELYKQ